MTSPELGSAYTTRDAEIDTARGADHPLAIVSDAPYTTRDAEIDTVQADPNQATVTKTVRYSIRDLQAGNFKVSEHPEAQNAVAMFRAGLRCINSGAIRRVDSIEPRDSFVRGFTMRLGRYKSSGYDVYLGPAAFDDGGALTVRISSERLANLGMWIPVKTPEAGDVIAPAPAFVFDPEAAAKFERLT